jgi:hypothetical protein
MFRILLLVFFCLVQQAVAAESCRSFMFLRNLNIFGQDVGHIAMGITSDIQTGYFAGQTVMFFGSLDGGGSDNSSVVGAPNFTFINNNFDNRSPNMMLEVGSDRDLIDFAKQQGYDKFAVTNSVCTIQGARLAFTERLRTNGFLNFTGQRDAPNYVLLGANCLNAAVQAHLFSGIPMQNPNTNWIPRSYFEQLGQRGWRIGTL